MDLLKFDPVAAILAGRFSAEPLKIQYSQHESKNDPLADDEEAVLFYAIIEAALSVMASCRSM